MGIKRCKGSFSVWNKDGVPRVIAGGDLIDENDPVYKGHESYFEDVEGYVSAREEKKQTTVEQATAAPGEQRDLTPPRRGRPPKRGA